MRAAILAMLVLTAPVAGASAQPAAPAGFVRGALRLENIPETPPDVAERLRRYVDVTGVSFADWMPDGGLLIYARVGETIQLHRVDRPLAAPVQLSFGDERVVSAAVMPAANDILFTRDTGGDETFAGYRLNLQSGEARRVTAPGTTNAGFVFSDDGERIAWAYAQVGGAASADVFAPASSRRPPEGESAVSPLDFTADRSKVLLQRFVSVSQSELFVLDLASGIFTRVTPAVEASYSGGEFTPDGRAIVTISDESSDYKRLVRIDIASGDRQVLTPDLPWDVESFDLAPHGRTIAYVVNEAGASSVRMMDARTMFPLRAPLLPRGVVSGLKFDSEGERLGFTLNRPTAPSDVYTWNIRARRLTRWTISDAASLPAFVEPELIRWRSFDEREINGFIYRPRTQGPHPVVIAIHGGPESQYRPIFSSAFQYWANELNIAVIAPNVRGSSGYGRVFLALDNGPLREDSVRDIGALLDWIEAQPDLDRNRIIVYGASYGGYLTLAAMMHYNDRLAGGVEIAGISNFASFLESPEGHRRDLRRAEYGDERDPAIRAMFDRISPLNNIAHVNRAILVVHGANDPRVPVSEADQVVAAVRRRGGEAWLMIAANEGHGFVRRENQQAQREAETMFFRRVLRLP